MTNLLTNDMNFSRLPLLSASQARPAASTRQPAPAALWRNARRHRTAEGLGTKGGEWIDRTF